MFDLTSLLSIAKNFGWSAAQTALIVALLWKIATNHLKHIADDIKTLSKAVEGVAADVKEIKKECGPCKERVAKLEGKLE